MNFALKNILFPVDFSNQAENALQTALAMCKRHGAVLHLLHVVENRLLMVSPDAAVSAIYVVPQLEKKGKAALAKLTDSIKDKGGAVFQSHLEFGNPADAIRDKAIELKCELIVMGTHGNSGSRDLFIGNTAYTVIKNTTIPVLTIPGNRVVTDFKKILFPVRAAKGAPENFEIIKPLIEQNKAMLLLLGLSLKSEKVNAEESQASLLKISELLELKPENVRTVIYTCTNYAKKVLEIAKKEQVDLLVINATLDFKSEQFFIGPFAQQIVNQAKAPVLSIRTPNMLTELKNTKSLNQYN